MYTRHNTLKNKFISGILLLTASTLLAQTKGILIMNGTVHTGTGAVIPNSVIGIRDGKIDMVGDAAVIRIDKAVYSEVIDAGGKHIYPGFIAPVTTLGLAEMDAVRATTDFREVGGTMPHVRSLIAYNTESVIIPTVRSNGILLAQPTPRGGNISGTSSIVKLDGWNWEDAVYRVDDGIHIHWPILQARRLFDDETAGKEKNKEYNRQLEDLKQLMAEAKAYYTAETKVEKNIRFEAIQHLFDGTETAFIHANDVKEIIEAVNFSKTYELKKVVIVGGRESWMVTDLLRDNNIAVIVSRLHELPELPETDVDQPYKLPFLLQQAGILFCLTPAGSKDAMSTRNLPFLAGTAAAYGLSKEQALQAITLNAAKILNIDKTTGSIETGKDATLFISTGDALDMRTNHLEQAFIKGQSIDLYNHQEALYDKYRKKYGLR